MIVNNEDLVPLDRKAEPFVSLSGESSDMGDFTARIAESFDSVDMLLAARAEAEAAEASAGSAVQTPLLYLQTNTDPPLPLPGDNGAGRFTLATAAEDSDSPAALNMLGDELRRLSDATSEETTLSAKDFMGGNLALMDLNEATSRTVVTGEIRDLSDIHIDELLRLTVESGASDLHLSVHLPPMVRKDGKLVALSFEQMMERDTQRIVFDILNNSQIEKFERTHELDFSYGVKGVGRFRFNVYRQRSSVGCAMRVIPNVVPSMDQLKLPPILRDLTHKHSGLVLVTGPTGSGKSTTIASMIDIINTERDCHILTIEDPIEYLHNHKKSMVNQRELGTDTDSFTNALRAALREDPDVILVGEMRDLETISAAITLAETGHLVFATLHTRSAAATIDRIVDVFPSHQQEQIRVQLSTSLESVVAQQLLPKIGGGRVAAIEVLIATSAVRNLIREGKTYQINSVIETGHQYGMQAMDRILADLHKGGTVTLEEAATRALDRDNFIRLLKGY